MLRGVHRLAERATEAYENARVEVATFLGVEPMEVVFTGGCTAAINLVAYSYGSLLKPGDRIILSELEHHSNIVPWQLLRQRSGIEIDVVPVTVDGRIDLNALPRLLTPRTKLISLAHVSNVTGTLVDVRAVVTLAKTVGAKVMLDGAQRAPHGPLDLPAMGIDFYVFAGHKAYGPNGIGVLWAKARASRSHAAVPWRRLDDRPRHLRRDDLGAAAAPLRGRHAADRPGDRPGRRLQVDARRSTGRQRTRTRWRWSQRADGRPAEDRRRAVVRAGQHCRTAIPCVSFLLDGVHPHDVAQTLDSFGVAVRAGHHCCQPLMDRFDLDGTTRVSIAPYNDNTDIDALLTGVQHAARTLR